MKTKTCRHCKEEIDLHAKKCPKCGGNQGLPTGVKIFIIIVVIILCIVGCTSACTSSVDDAINETANEYKDINGKTEFKVNETFQNASEKITMTETNTNFTDYGKYSGPSDGKKYILVKFEVENVGNDEEYISSLDFNGYADDIAVDDAYISNDNYNDLSATIGVGKKAIGYIAYEVPIDTQKFEIEYNASIWEDGTNVKFIVQ